MKKEITVNGNDCGQRLDKFIKKTFPHMPDGFIYKAIRKKDIRINGKRAEPSQMLCKGDALYIYAPDDFIGESEKSRPYLHAKSDIAIVYEDENILLVNKPVGLVCHEDNEHSGDTLINRIQAYLYRSGSFDPEKEHAFAPALCNRIDRNTSGIVIAAKNAEALRIMNEKIRERKIVKKYLLAVCGHMPQKSGRLKDYLRKDGGENRVYVEKHKSHDNVTAITNYRVLRETGDLSLIEAELLTGRTHQIRAQFAAAGHPLLGDSKYAVARVESSYGYKHQALVSYKLEFLPDEKGGILRYLDGKKFEIGDIPFLILFE